MAEDSTNTILETSLDEKLQSINRTYVEEETARRAKKAGYGYVELTKVPINPDYLRLLPYEKAVACRGVVFFRVGQKVRLAFEQWSAAVETVVHALEAEGYTVELYMVSEVGISYGLSLYKKYKLIEEEKVGVHMEASTLKAYEKELEDIKSLESTLETVSPEQALVLIEGGAMKTGASDIHFQPEEDGVRVRMRIDGVLHDTLNISRKLYEELVRQIKYKAHMKVNIDHLPQDGRFYFEVNERQIQVRVSSLPTDFGETFVLRLLDDSKGILDFKSLGFEGYNLSTLYRALSKSAGVILLTGPTGSGKTTTLYSILHTMNAPEKKICTLEDPVEYRLPYLSQSQINENVGYGFATGLRAILRQDPDVVMVGEIRDVETAEIAMQASLTGHVVLSTLHTNTAVEAIARLINMGLPSYIVAPGLTCVIGQRLVRKLCTCAKEVPIPEQERPNIEAMVKEMEGFHPQYHFSIPETIREPGGCELCSHTGYLGQIALIEVFYVDREIKNMIFEGKLASAIQDAARTKGMFTIMEVGLVRVFQGVTTLSEIYRVGKV